MPTLRVDYSISEQRLAELVRDAVSKMSTDERGSVTWGVSFPMDAMLEIISRNIHISEIDDVDAVRKLTTQALSRLYREGGGEYRFFKGFLAEQAQSYLASPSEEFQVVAALNARKEDIERVGPIELLGSAIQTAEWPELEKTLDTKSWFDEMEAYRVIERAELQYSSTFTLLIARAKGRDKREGFNTAYRGLHLFRALLNMASSFRRRWIMRDPPLADFLLSPVSGLFDRNGQYLWLYYALQKYKYGRKDLSEDRANFLNSLLSQIRTPSDPNETMSLITDGLGKYGEAMDATEWQRSFLSLWQILEAVTLQRRDIRMGEVAVRTKLLLGNDPLFSDLVECAKNARNEYVHQGLFAEHGLTDVNFLKIIVESVLYFLIRNESRLSSRKELDWFYTYGAQGGRQLNERIQFLENLLEWHQEKREDHTGE